MTSATARATKGEACVVESLDRDAFDAFYRRYGGQMQRALALTLGDSELARDAMQEAMARAWRSWSRVRMLGNPCGWVYRVGLNWGRSRLRRLSREVLGATHERATAALDPPDPAVARALRSLPERHRAVVVLRLYLDWSVEDVATALDIPAGTVRSRQHTAMNHLRKKLEPER